MKKELEAMHQEFVGKITILESARVSLQGMFTRDSQI